MRISVLGSLRVTTADDVDLTPTQPKLRQLIALLAVNGGSVVRTETISRELWEAEPVDKTIRILQTNISHLRRAWGSPETVVHTPKVGYQLRAASVDLQAFRDLTAAGGECVRDGRLADAAGSFRAALEICRGPALSDVGVGPVLTVQRQRLDALKGSVLGRYLGLELRLGRPARVVDQLDRVLLENHRSTEAYACLMRALAAVGRRPEAIDLYHSIAEPDLRIQDAFRELTVNSAVRVAPVPAAPCQLPLPVPDFTGFRSEVATAEAALTGPGGEHAKVVSVISAPGGGSSTFCTHVANRVAKLFPGGQLYADLDTRSADDVLADLLRTVGVEPPAGRLERIRQFRQRTANRGILVLLDNVNDPTAAAMLQPGAGGALLFASRIRHGVDTASALIDLPRMAPAELARLFAAWAGFRRVAAEPEATRRLVAGCDGLPLALRQLAGLVARRPHWTLGRLAERLCDLELLPGSTLDRQRRFLTDSEWMALRRIAGRAWLSADCAARILGMTPSAAEALLEKLVEVRLADPDRDGYRIGHLYRRGIRPLTSRELMTSA